jgi:hypothetical protein
MTIKYIPPGRYEPGPAPAAGWYPFRLQNTYAGAAAGVTTDASGLATANSFEARYLIETFGLRPTPDANGYNSLPDLGWGLFPTGTRTAFPNGGQVQLDANQTLTFFLGGIPNPLPTAAPFSPNLTFNGFSTNPSLPFVPRVSDEPRCGLVLDLGGSPRKYAVDGTNGFARLIDAYDNPFAYFAPFGGLRNKFYGGFNALPQGAVAAYSSNGSFENPEGFQLISSGRDGQFGPGGNWPPVPVIGEDDQANFSPSVLGAGK